MASELDKKAAPMDIPVPAIVVNPSNTPGITADTRIPMSTPSLKLEIDENLFPGHRLYWFLGSKVPRAQRAGYEFINSDEISLNQKGVATDASLSGNADMGSRVSQIAGVGVDGKPEYLYLMKIKREWFLEDQRKIEAVNAGIMDAIKKKRPIVGDNESQTDASARYVRQSELSQPYNQPKRRA